MARPKKNFFFQKIPIFQEVKRCVSMGIKGFEVGSHVAEKSLDHRDFWPLYKVSRQQKKSTKIKNSASPPPGKMRGL